MLALHTTKLTRRFATVVAVDGIDLDVEAGKIFAFLGKNGSGKTTTVRMLTTLLRPTSGRALVGGLDVERDSAKIRRRIGVALQDAGLDDVQTGRELLELQGRLYGISDSRAKDRAKYLLGVIELEAVADRRIKTYSGGMKRRLDLASALVHEPDIVFLDEPTTGLDPSSRMATWRYISDLNAREGVTFFLTTQYLEEADQLADELAIIHHGRIIAQGRPSELKSAVGSDVISVRVEGGLVELERAAAVLGRIDTVRQLRISGPCIVAYLPDGSKALAGVVRLFDDTAVQVTEITLARPSLEDVFLRITGERLERNSTYDDTATEVASP
jgi:ABC-2 type transport system ATP-binding protein